MGFLSYVARFFLFHSLEMCVEFSADILTGVRLILKNSSIRLERAATC